jgi:BASS family bile acid:Na+ symporter
MDLAAVLQLALSASVIMIVFSLGLQSTLLDATYLFRQPRRFLRSLSAMAIIMPLFAGMLVGVMELLPPVEVTLIVLSVSPVPPILPRKELAAGGNRSYALGLLVAAAVTSILFVPVAVELFGWVFDRHARISPFTIARIVLTTVIGPLAAGSALRSIWGGMASRLAAPLSRVATLLLVASVLPVIFVQGSAVISLIGDGTLVAMAAFVTAGFAAGALLGGPELAQRTVLAQSTACRHPGVAMAIASANFPEQRLVLPSVLLYLIVSTLLSWVFLRWLRASASTAGRNGRQSPAA